ncbi:MAG: sigma-70 family RNA polymerase sigma factor, partial [Gemmatimonadetes bacterium]|nr:sigma-70 family RNA polymerase sigma factor [Gemmatimonadota bacterium]
MPHSGGTRRAVPARRCHAIRRGRCLDPFGAPGCGSCDPRFPGAGTAVRMSDSAASGSLDLPEALRALTTTDGTKAPDDACIDSRAFRRGDPECFALVLRRFGPLIKSIVAAYAEDPDDQDDLYQEVCIRLLTRRKSYKEIGAMEG